MNLWIEIIHNCSNVRYWSEFLYYTIPSHMNSLEVKVTDLGKIYVKVYE